MIAIADQLAANPDCLRTCHESTSLTVPASLALADKCRHFESCLRLCHRPDDLRQARELALLICSSEEAIETFIAHCDVAARDLLMPYGDVVIALSTVLRIKRTLDGREIDEIISDVQARKALAIEQQRRADWRKSELAAARFRAECEPLDAAPRMGMAHQERGRV